jgi:hypothetical protein
VAVFKSRIKMKPINTKETFLFLHNSHYPTDSLAIFWMRLTKCLQLRTNITSENMHAAFPHHTAGRATASQT